MIPQNGYVYFLKDYTAPKVFNGLYYDCLLTDQKIPAYVPIVVNTGIRITDWPDEIFQPERFNLLTK